MEAQLFCGLARPMPELMRPVLNGLHLRGIETKGDGGIWTSTWNAAKGQSPWTRLCQRRHWPWWLERRWWLLTPRTDARILTIDSHADLIAACERYPRMRLGFPLLIDYMALSQDYDALRLTAKGERETRKGPCNLYGWDSESTWWFHWAFAEDVELIAEMSARIA